VVDVGNLAILNSLEKIAPVAMVRGNVDRADAFSRLPETDVLCLERHYNFLLNF
jgi:predicted phosphodiesterase